MFFAMARDILFIALDPKNHPTLNSTEYFIYIKANY